jgi:hypothetical protein
MPPGSDSSPPICGSFPVRRTKSSSPLVNSNQSGGIWFLGHERSPFANSNQSGEICFVGHECSPLANSNQSGGIWFVVGMSAHHSPIWICHVGFGFWGMSAHHSPIRISQVGFGFCFLGRECSPLANLNLNLFLLYARPTNSSTRPVRKQSIASAVWPLRITFSETILCQR